MAEGMQGGGGAKVLCKSYAVLFLVWTGGAPGTAPPGHRGTALRCFQTRGELTTTGAPQTPKQAAGAGTGTQLVCTQPPCVGSGRLGQQHGPRACTRQLQSCLISETEALGAWGPAGVCPPPDKPHKEAALETALLWLPLLRD